MVNALKLSAELAEFLAVGNKFGVGAGAEFVEIETLSFALERHALRPDSVQGEIESVGQGQYEADEGGHGYDLRERLTCIAGGSRLRESSADVDHRSGEAPEN